MTALEMCVPPIRFAHKARGVFYVSGTAISACRGRWLCGHLVERTQLYTYTIVFTRRYKYVKYHVCDPTWDLKILLVRLVCILNSIPGISETAGVMVNLAVIGSILLPNVGACINGLYFAGQFRKKSGSSWYDELKKPAWHPPQWAIGPGWIFLYSGMGYASYLVYEECGGFTEDAVLPLSLYGAQLALNWAWTPMFFGLRNFKLSFLGASVLSGAVVATAVSFYRVNKTAGALLLPYLAWLACASSIVHYLWKNNPEKEE